MTEQHIDVIDKASQVVIDAEADDDGATSLTITGSDVEQVKASKSGASCGVASLLTLGASSGMSQPAISFDNTKAGLQSVDKAHTEAIIKGLSEGSPFYANEQRKIAMRQRRLQKLQEKVKVYDKVVRPDPRLYKKVVDRVARYEAVLEARRRFDRIYVHMDMDMFFAAVAQKKNPSLADVPFGVGSLQMLSTTNYIARQYGVRSGMAGFVGRKLCPQLVIVPTDFQTYKLEAEQVRAVAARYDPHYCSHGLDELRMEMSAYCAQHCPEATSMAARYDAVEVAMRECRANVQAATGLTASVGIAPTGTLAKIASNYEKPNGQHTLRLLSRAAVMDFVGALPVRRIPGIGQSQEFILAGLGVKTMGDLYEQRHRLAYAMTEKTFLFLLAASLGVGSLYDDGDDDDRDDDSEEGGGGEDGGDDRERSDMAATKGGRAGTTVANKDKRRGTSHDGGDEEGGIGAHGGPDVGATRGDATTPAATSDDEGDSDDSSEVGGVESWRKSIGQERTFARLDSAADLRRIAQETLRVAHERMLRKGCCCGRIVLKTKQRNFHVHQYSKSVAPASTELPVLQRVVDELVLPLVDRYAEYRLLGVRLEKLTQVTNIAAAPQRTLKDYFADSPVPPQRGCKRDRGDDVVIDLTNDDENDVVSDEKPTIIVLTSSEEDNSASQ